jgi:transketolase
MDKRSFELRLKILKILKKSRRGHIGSPLSILEIVRVLYDDILQFDSKQPNWSDRDRFILSKGHGCLALYLLLADKGFFPDEELYQFCEFESRLGGHPEYSLPGVEAATGALGHGLSIGVGIALAAKIDKKQYQTYVVVGDGECQEGAIWEAALSASKHKLDNLTVLIDYNKMQCYGPILEVQDLKNLPEKWRSFGFEVRECDGHDVDDLKKQLSFVPYKKNKPNLLICNTKKGMGFNSMIDNPVWHHKSRMSDDDIKELHNDLEKNK